MSDETADVLDAAADRLTGKWTTRQLRDPATYTGTPAVRVDGNDTCKVDAVGAICWAITGDPLDPGDLTLFTACLAAADVQGVAGGYSGIVAYQDATGRTVAQVQARLHAAADTERA